MIAMEIYIKNTIPVLVISLLSSFDKLIEVRPFDM